MADHSEANWDDCMEYAILTDIGMRRANNQDSLTGDIAPNEEIWAQRGHLFMVADGMGAHAAGELASKLAVDGVPHHYRKYADLSAPEALQRAICETNAEVHRRGQANSDFHNMGTTASTLVLLPQGSIVGHVGDSRVYRLRGDTLEQITFDHSLVWEMRAAGQLPEGSDLSAAIPKNVITRSLGPNPTVQVDLEGPLPIEVGDVYLLCSDGLTGEVPDEEMAPILANLPPAEAAQVLIDLANLRGGPDNISVIVVRITGERMATNSSRREPLKIGRTRKPNVHPAWWVAAGVCLLTAGVLWLTGDGNFMPALIVGIGGFIVLAISLWKQFRGAGGGIALSHGRRLGKAPYVSVQCTATEHFMYKLSEIVEELRDAAMERDWRIDWRKFDHHCRQAYEARMASEFARGVREYARAISFLMAQLRSQHASDSAIES